MTYVDILVCARMRCVSPDYIYTNTPLNLLKQGFQGNCSNKSENSGYPFEGQELCTSDR